MTPRARLARGMSLKEIGARVDAALRVEPYRVLAGVDEAGLGPMLGPLSIGFSALRLPTPDTCLWTALKSSRARRAENGGSS